MAVVFAVWTASAEAQDWTGGSPPTGTLSGSPPLYDVSCPSASACFALGYDSRYEQGVLLATTDGGRRWSAQSPAASDGLSAIDCPSPRTCYAVGNGIFAMPDGGSSWRRQYSDPSGYGYLYGISCPNASTCFAVGYEYDSNWNLDATILATTDGGESWSRQSPDATGLLSDIGYLSDVYLFGISCATASSCVAVGSEYDYSYGGYYGMTLTTKNGGESWLRGSGTGGSGLSAVSCSSALTCIAVGEGIYATADGGLTWVESYPGLYLSDVSCVDDSTCFAAGWEGWDITNWGWYDGCWCRNFNSQAKVYAVTTAGILVAERSPAYIKASLTGISCADESSCVAVGAADWHYNNFNGRVWAGFTKGQVVATADGGESWANWQAWTSSTESDLNDVSCPKPRTCYAVGNSGTIMTMKNGHGWQSQNVDASDGLLMSGLYGVSCPNASTCFAVGDGGILATSDGGENWTLRPAYNTAAPESTWVGLRDVSCPSALECVAVGYSYTGLYWWDTEGVILTTKDGGLTWSAHSTATDIMPYGTLSGVSCADESSCVAVGGAYSYDQNWNYLSSATVLTTADGGITWTAQDPASSNWLSDVSCPREGICLAVSDSNEILKTTNGGASWSLVGSGSNLTAVDCASTEECGAAGIGWGNWWDGYSGEALTTLDGGQSWWGESFNPPSALFGVSCFSPSDSSAWECIAVGEAGTIVSHRVNPDVDAPFNTIPPQISGTPTVGQTLTVSEGAWDGQVRSYSYRWLRDGEPIDGATSYAYELTAADSGKAIGAKVTAATATESATASADPVSVGGAPVNTSRPRISGAPQVGKTLTASRGSWAGTASITYAYQWQRCEEDGIGCEPIADASTHRYVLTDDDLGMAVHVAVTATNGPGSGSATSAPTGAVAPSRASADGPLAGVLPSESPVGPVAGTDPFAPPGSGYVAAVEQPNVARMPYFNAYFEPAGESFAPRGSPTHHVSTAVGDGLVFVGSEERGRVYAFNAVTLAENYSFAAPGVRGLAYAAGELFAVEHSDTGPEVGVYDGLTGAPKRTLVPPLGGALAAADLGTLTGVSIAFGEAWLAFEGGPAGAAVMILDAQTGTLRAVGWHFGRYDCALSAEEYELDPERCLEDASADTGPANPAWWDISTTPELGGAFAGCRFINRELLFSALAADDIYVGDATLSSDCATGRYTDPNGVLQEAPGAIDGTYAVPGMGWVLSMAPDASGRLGSYVREYDAGSSLSSFGASELNLARSWRPRDHKSSNHRDIAYLNREVRIDWKGELTDPDWQRGTRCLTYNISDADIFVIGSRGELWFEPARTFEYLDVKLDGAPVNVTLGGLPAGSRLSSPIGNPCLDLDPIPSGVHELTLLATLEGGKQVSITNDKLRVDHDIPNGTLEAPQGFIRRTVTIPGTMADEHAGPASWRLEVQRAGAGTWTTICTDNEADPVTGKVQCEWNTNSGNYPDGAYTLRALVQDQVGRGGPNATLTSTGTTRVDNTSPTFSNPSPSLEEDSYEGITDQVQELQFDQTDNGGSGLSNTLIEMNTATDGSASGAWVPIGNSDQEGAPVRRSWDTGDWPGGLYRFRATACDRVGNCAQREWQAVMYDTRSRMSAGSGQGGSEVGSLDWDSRPCLVRQFRCYAAAYFFPGERSHSSGIRATITTPQTIDAGPQTRDWQKRFTWTHVGIGYTAGTGSVQSGIGISLGGCNVPVENGHLVYRKMAELYSARNVTYYYCGVRTREPDATIFQVDKLRGGWRASASIGSRIVLADVRCTYDSPDATAECMPADSGKGTLRLRRRGNHSTYAAGETHPKTAQIGGVFSNLMIQPTDGTSYRAPYPDALEAQIGSDKPGYEITYQGTTTYCVTDTGRDLC